ncbi:MAG: malectin domain-containing carbohydrate-binding protein, partial [Candidatus Aminicenantales bacterium]
SPQLWAGRMRRDAVDALRYGCDGLFGIHWRTRILSPNVLALARAAWDQSWNNVPMAFADQIGPRNGVYVRAPEAAMPGTGETAIYRDVRDRVNGYRILVPDGVYAVTLKFCETEFDKKGARVFDIYVQGKKAAENVDLIERAGRYKPYDLTVPAVEVQGGRLSIDFVDRIHYPSIAGIVIQGPAFTKKINCGGPQTLDYDADWPETPRYLGVEDLYRDWARNQFGRGPDTEIAALFTRVDGRLPIPVTWTTGPGGIRPDARPWGEVAQGFSFVDELAALRPRVLGVGNLERFDYWLKNFQAMRETARFQCVWSDYNKALEKVKALPDAAAKAVAAKESLLGPRIEMAKALKIILGNLAATASNTGEMGTIANWEQHLIPEAFLKPGEELKALFGGSLPSYADLTAEYDGPARVVVPTVRTIVAAGETLVLKAMVLASEPPEAVTLKWRALGAGKFTAVGMEHAARRTYRVSLPALTGDIEYYIEAKTGGRDVFFPVTAPALNQTVVVMR